MSQSRKAQYSRRFFAALAVAALSSGCLQPPQSYESAPLALASSTPTPTFSFAPGARAVKILFKLDSGSGTSGSFDSSVPDATLGTIPAVRLFTPDASSGSSATSVLANGTSDPNWPKWLKSVELRTPGAGCAGFAAAGEESTQCDLDMNGSAETACGPPSSHFRVNEIDCSRNNESAESVGVRVTFDRNTAYMGTHENIMAVLEYSASSVNRGATDPSLCFSGGVFTPENTGCADMVWQTFLRKNPTDVVQPFLMLIPPIPTPVTRSPAGTVSAGGTVTSKQLFLPLAANSGLTEFSISRISGWLSSSIPVEVSTACNGGVSPSNSPHCAGVVLYTLTLIRM